LKREYRDRESSDRAGSSDSSSGGESDVDMDALAREEEVREKEEQLEIKLASMRQQAGQGNGDVGGTTKTATTMATATISMGTAIGAGSDSEDEFSGNYRERYGNSSDSAGTGTSTDTGTGCGSGEGKSSASAVASQMSNLSAAQLLRAKLKQKSSTSSATATLDESYSNNAVSVLPERTLDPREKYKQLGRSVSISGELSVAEMRRQERFGGADQTDVDVIFRNNVIKMGDKYVGNNNNNNRHTTASLKKKSGGNNGDDLEGGDSDEGMERVGQQKKRSRLDLEDENNGTGSEDDQPGGNKSYAKGGGSTRSGILQAQAGNEDDDLDMSLFTAQGQGEKPSRQVFQSGGVSSEESKLRLEAQRKIRKQEKERNIHDKCGYCTSIAQTTNGCRINSPLVLSLAPNSYIRMKPLRLSLCQGHCEIIPLQHTKSLLLAESDCVKEVKRYKQCLERFFESNDNQGVIFIEVALQSPTSGSGWHTHIDVIPIHSKYISDVPIYVKQALLGCDEEWSEHQKIIPMRSVGGKDEVSKLVPKGSGYGYVTVEWYNGKGGTGADGTSDSLVGYAHVIEDESKFTDSFGLDIIRNMLLQLQDEAELDAEQFGGDPDMVFRPHSQQWNHSAGSGGGKLKPGGGNNAHSSGLKTAEDKLVREFLSEKRRWKTLDWTEYE